MKALLVAVFVAAAVFVRAAGAAEIGEFVSSTLPVLVVHTAAESYASIDEVGDDADAGLTVLYAGEGEANALDDTPNGTFPVVLGHAFDNKNDRNGWPKPNLGLRAVTAYDGSRAAASVPLADFPAGGSWSLQASYADRSHLHHAFGMYLAEAAGALTPRWRFVEVFVVFNATDVEGALPAAGVADYYGLYLLREEPTRGGGRVDVEEMTAAAATDSAMSGGWIFHAGVDQGEPEVESDAGTVLRVDYPALPTAAQLSWLDEHLEAIEYSLFFESEFNATSDLWRCPRYGYASTLDADSFLAVVLASEISFGPNEYARHAYFYKRRNNKVFAGPALDYELGFGVVTDSTTPGRVCCRPVDGFRWGEDLGPLWFKRLNEDASFRCRFRELYLFLREDGQKLHDDQWLGFVNNRSAEIADAADRERVRWDWATTPQAAPTVEPGATQTALKDYMVGWVRSRLGWLDTNVGADTDFGGVEAFCADPSAEYARTEAVCDTQEAEFSAGARPAAAALVLWLAALAAAAAGLWV